MGYLKLMHSSEQMLPFCRYFPDKKINDLICFEGWFDEIHHKISKFCKQKCLFIIFVYSAEVVSTWRACILFKNHTSFVLVFL